MTTDKQKQQWLRRALGPSERHLDTAVQLPNWVATSDGPRMHALQSLFNEPDVEHPQFVGLSREVLQAEGRIREGAIVPITVSALRARIAQELERTRFERTVEITKALVRLAEVQQDKRLPARRHHLASAKAAVSNAKLMARTVDMARVCGLDPEHAPVFVDSRFLLAAIPAGARTVRVSVPDDLYAGPAVLSFWGDEMIAAIMGARP